MMVFVQKNTSVHGLCVVFMGFREGVDLLLSQAACFSFDAGQKWVIVTEFFLYPSHLRKPSSVLSYRLAAHCVLIGNSQCCTGRAG